MTSIQITSKIDLDQLISGVAQLETSELEVYAEKISLLVDPASRTEANLFHPRQQRWNEHFTWNEDF